MGKNRLIVLAAAIVALSLAVATGCQKEEGDNGAAELKKRAEAAFANGEYEAADRYYERLLTEYPEWSAEAGVGEGRSEAKAKALFVRARKLARSGHYEKAGEVLNEALTLRPDDAEINYGVGWVYIEMALRYQTQAHVGRAATRVDYAILADAHAELARERFERSRKLDAKHWAGYRGMAIYYIFSEQYEKALESLTEAEKYSTATSDKIAVARLRVQVYLGQEDAEKAKEAVDKLLEDFPDRGEAYSALAEYYIGEYYRTRNESVVDEAVKALEVGVEKEFEDEETRNRMYIMLSRLRLSTGDYDGAVSAAKVALRGDPFNELYTDQYTVAWGAKKMAEKKK